MLPREVLDTLGPLGSVAQALAGDLVDRRAPARTFEGDHTLWRDDPTELADRLGWIGVVDDLRDGLGRLAERCDRLAHGVDDVLLMGMGGSSLFPEVLARTYGPRPGRPQLRVLDTTDPRTITRIARECRPERTLFVASSKSGSTLETRSHLEWAWRAAGGDAPFAVITDPGSALGVLAHDRGFAEVFENRPDIGGRYSALSLFGVVPALLAGLDASALLAGGADALACCGPGAGPVTMAAGVRAGRDKLTVELPPETATFGLWLEQLIAESLGKDGTGVVPIVGERPAEPQAYGSDRTFVVVGHRPERVEALRLAGHPVLVVDGGADLRSLGRQVVVWELAAAKDATARVLAGEVEPPAGTTPLSEALDAVRPGDHLALQAFVDPLGGLAGRLDDVRTALRDRLGVAVSLGYGPRFLHSTGQLHKGGPDAIVCIQVLDEVVTHDVDVPGRAETFGAIERAQADGDLITLRERGRRAFRVPLDELLGVAS
jgi:transaldolase/glucose-6-phosphate isomerase